MSPFKRIGAILALATLAAVFAACEFEPAITPIVWVAPGAQSFGEISSNLTPEPSPIPAPPTPQPPFDGVDSLSCTEPAGGDNHYGYCRIPGTQEFYVWGECVDECTEGQYPGIELMNLEGSDDALSLYRDVIDERDMNLDARGDGWFQGGILGGLGAGAAGAGIPAACIASGVWNMGIGCGLVLLGVGAAGLLSYLGFSDANEANDNLNDPLGLNFSAQDLFQQIVADGASPSN